MDDMQQRDAEFTQNYEPAAYQPYRPPVPPRVYYPVQTRERIFAVIAPILGIADVSVTLWGGFQVGFTVSFLLTFLFTTLYLLQKHRRIQIYPLICFLLAVAGSGIFVIQQYSSVHFFMMVAMFALSAVWCHSLGQHPMPTEDGATLRMLFSSTFGSAFGGMGTAMRSLFRKREGSNGRLGKILVGVLCAVPVLTVVVPLLMSSDAAFSGLIKHICEDLGELLFKVILGVFYGVLLISYAFHHRMKAPRFRDRKPRAGIEGVYVAAFLGTLSVCYLTYLFSQLAYFFDAFSGILPEAYSAADYARRGFFEMAFIAVINLGVLSGTLALSRRQNGKTAVSVRILSLFVCLFTLVIVGTSLSKMFMYIHRFGMTRLRITTSAFMVFLGIAFLAVAVKYFLPRTPVVRIALIAGTCILLLLGYGNINRTVAEYNINAYRTGKLSTLDVYTISDLGSDSIPYLITLTQDEDETVADKAWDSLYDYVQYLYERKDKVIVHKKLPVSTWTVSRMRAYQILDAYLEETNDAIFLHPIRPK